MNQRSGSIYQLITSKRLFINTTNNIEIVATTVSNKYENNIQKTILNAIIFANLDKLADANAINQNKKT